ncbi:leucine-rich repeat-containing protein 3-like [Xyrauchen texanus]|uniref:leucine-rich repeat-containing protein 3-like n=1 Tax=Xyrauchen texanus TaxID=154827 RepID=UPI002241D951|nr:leucine-rich repeat-containing protein 3-like [Xyrauchen texanus]
MKTPTVLLVETTFSSGIGSTDKSKALTALNASTTLQEVANLQAQGFKKLSVNLNKGTTGTKVYVWHMKEGCESQIQSMVLLINPDTWSVYKKEGIIVIDKNLNEGNKGWPISSLKEGELQQHADRRARGLPNITQHLYLDNNLLVTIPSDSFVDLPLLFELDLSHNRLVHLEPGAFLGLAGSLSRLDLSSNQLETLDPMLLGDLSAQTNLSHNPWLCDCRLQLAMPQQLLDPSSLAEVVCNNSEPEELGAQGMPFILVAADLDFCAALRRTTDVAMLITMFGWFIMVISYMVYYVRHNQEEAICHLEYLKSLPSRQGGIINS